jgi:glycosyltransferase involved in cell wall biosynthesis
VQKLSDKYDFILKVVGAEYRIQLPGVKTDNREWDLKREVEDFQSLDIGLYPLIDDEWARGKAGFKAIQYMSVGVPVIASPVGVVKEIIEDGVNGFTASTEDEWVEKISRLIENNGLRRDMGANGRKTVEERYSLAVNAKKFVGTLNV